MQILSAIGGSEQLPTPALSSASAGAQSFSFTITNYDAANTYVLSTTGGSVSRSVSTVSVTGLGNAASATVSVYATKVGFDNSATATRAGTSLTACSNTGYSYTTINGGNLGTCGIIACGAGQNPAYDTLWVQVSPDPCVSGSTPVSGGYVTYNGSWYCLTTGYSCP